MNWVFIKEKGISMLKKLILVGLIGFTVFEANSFFGKKAASVSKIKSSPVIAKIVWGEITVSQDGSSTLYKDAKLSPNGAKDWNWSAHNPATQHRPGIQISDIEEFISGPNEVDVIILTRGVDLVLQIPQSTIDYIKSKGKVCYDGQTNDMVALYNKLVAEGKIVGGVFHSTC